MRETPSPEAARPAARGDEIPSFDQDNWWNSETIGRPVVTKWPSGCKGECGSLSSLCMQVVLNGEPREVGEGISVADLIATLSLNGRRLAVELNREVLPREQYGSRALAPGDVIEIVHFIGGG
jgi:sulfur carrier protein